MNIVTLTTDYGYKDYYSGLLKGQLLSKGIPLTLVDITHSIDNYNIVQTAFVLRNAYTHFPAGTVHIVSVNNFYDAQPRFLAVEYQGHYFLGPDNGFFSLMFDQMPTLIYELKVPEALVGKIQCIAPIFAAAVEHIFSFHPFCEIGIPLNSYVQRISLQPIIGKNFIRGAVIYIDNYENVILNIDKALFERVGQGRSFELYFKRHDPIVKLCNNYADVPIGDLLCLVNSAGLFEIAVNMGKASTLFGLRMDDTVQLDFLEA